MKQWHARGAGGVLGALAALAALTLAPSGEAGAQASPPRPLVLVNATVLDGTGAPPVRGATVVVEGGRIVRVGTGDVARPTGAEVIDVGGRWVLPGLIDAHTHVSTLDAARRALESGVTTIRSASVPAFQDVALRELARRGAIAGPDVLAAGVFVTPQLGETALADPRLAPLAALEGGVTTPEALRALVRVNLERGVDVVKTRGTERAGLPNTDPRKQTYTEAQLRAVVEEAATRGVPVLAHAHGDEGARAAVLAGVRSIEHGTYLSDTTLRLMQERGTFLVPTYVTVEDLTQPGGDYDDPVLTLRGRHMLPVLAETVKRARTLGVRVVTGVDTDYGPRSLSRVAHEVAAFASFGFPPMEALQAATAHAADALGIADRTGRIRAGLEADLIVIERDPLADVGALQDVLVVVSNGRVGLNRLPFGKK